MERLDEGATLACSLNDAEFRERRALVRQTLIAKITTSERTPTGLILSFAQSEQLREDLETFINLERQCCGFLEFTIRPSTVIATSLELHIEGAPDAALTIEMFARAAHGTV